MGGNAPECSVLRCQEGGGGVFIRNGLPRLEWVVCETHGNRLQTGEPRSYDIVQGPILMGIDVASSQDWLVDGWHLEGSSESSATYVTLSLTRLDTTHRQTQTFVLTPDLRRRLAEALSESPDDQMTPGGHYQSFSGDSGSLQD